MNNRHLDGNRTNSDSLVSRLREMGQLAWADRNAYGTLGDYELVAHDLRAAADEIERLRGRLEQEGLDRIAEHHLVVNIEHWSGLEAINSIGAPAALEKINAECRAHLGASRE